MPTQHVRRVLCICPEARVAALNTWISANLADAGTGDWLTVPLNASGNDGDAVTHRWFSAGLQEDDLRKVLVRLAALAGITAPSNWGTMTPAQKATWINSNLPTVKQNTGILVKISPNDGAWDVPDDCLTAESLKRRKTS